MSRFDNLDRWSLPDEHVELPGIDLRLAWCVNADGSRWPWLVAPDRSDDLGCHCAAHEELGPLPDAVARRLQDVLARPPRCGSTRRDGGRCRALVPAHGRRCRHHDTASTRTREDA